MVPPGGQLVTKFFGLVVNSETLKGIKNMFGLCQHFLRVSYKFKPKGFSLFYCLGGTCSMTKFYKRQQLLKFRCLCDFCKHGDNTDIKAYEEFERLNQEREKIALEKGLYNNFGANFCFLLN